MFNHPRILLRLYAAAALSEGREDKIHVSDPDV